MTSGPHPEHRAPGVFSVPDLPPGWSVSPMDVTNRAHDQNGRAPGWAYAPGDLPYPDDRYPQDVSPRSTSLAPVEAEVLDSRPGSGNGHNPPRRGGNFFDPPDGCTPANESGAAGSQPATELDLGVVNPGDVPESPAPDPSTVDVQLATPAEIRAAAYRVRLAREAFHSSNPTVRRAFSDYLILTGLGEYGQIGEGSNRYYGLVGVREDIDPGDSTPWDALGMANELAARVVAKITAVRPRRHLSRITIMDLVGETLSSTGGYSDDDPELDSVYSGAQWDELENRLQNSGNEGLDALYRYVANRVIQHLPKKWRAGVPKRDNKLADRYAAAAEEAQLVGAHFAEVLTPWGAAKLNSHAEGKRISDVVWRVASGVGAVAASKISSRPRRSSSGMTTSERFVGVNKLVTIAMVGSAALVLSRTLLSIKYGDVGHRASDIWDTYHPGGAAPGSPWDLVFGSDGSSGQAVDALPAPAETTGAPTPHADASHSIPVEATTTAPRHANPVETTAPTSAPSSSHHETPASGATGHATPASPSSTTPHSGGVESHATSGAHGSSTAGSDGAEQFMTHDQLVAGTGRHGISRNEGVLQYIQETTGIKDKRVVNAIYDDMLQSQSHSALNHAGVTMDHGDDLWLRLPDNKSHTLTHAQQEAWARAVEHAANTRRVQDLMAHAAFSPSGAGGRHVAQETVVHLPQQAAVHEAVGNIDVKPNGGWSDVLKTNFKISDPQVRSAVLKVISGNEKIKQELIDAHVAYTMPNGRLGVAHPGHLTQTQQQVLERAIMDALHSKQLAEELAQHHIKVAA